MIIVSQLIILLLIQKFKKLGKKMLHITNIAAITDLNTKAAEIGNKIPGINNVATKATL